MLGLPTGKDAVIVGQIALFGYRLHCPPLWFFGLVFPPVSSLIGSSITVGLRYSRYILFMFGIWTCRLTDRSGKFSSSSGEI